MKNYPNEARTPYGGYRGAATAQPFEAPNDLQKSSPKSYYPPSDGGNQQQEQLYSEQQFYEHQQPYFAPPASFSSPDDRTWMVLRAPAAGWLSYLGGWVTGLLFFLLKKENRFVRFHAMQSIIASVVLFVLYIVVTILAALPLIGLIACFLWPLLWLATLALWIILMIQGFQGKYFKLPIIGDYAERYANSGTPGM